MDVDEERYETVDEVYIEREAHGKFKRKGKEYVKPTDEFAKAKLQTTKNLPRAKYSKEERDNEADSKLLRRANAVVTKPITRLYNPGGRPKKYTPTKMRNRINDYFCYCEKQDKVPSMKGMMLYLKMTPASGYKYMEYEDYKDIFEQARMIISEWLESDVYTSRGQAAGKLAYMQNLHNWSQKTEIETNQRELTVEEARAKIAALAPALLDMIRTSPEILNQLLPPESVKVAIDVSGETH